MIKGTTISTAIEKGKRIVKMILFGKNDIRTAPDAGPYGTDANPIAKMEALYIRSSINGKPVFIGVINTQQLAAAGEHRIYATDADGAEKVRIWLHANGDIELGGTGAANSNAKHLTEYEALNTKLQDQITKINAQLDLIATGITGVGGAYVPTHIVEDFSSAKTNKIKIP